MYGTLISSVTVGAGGASSITFSAIPGTYTDLCLVLSGRSTNSNYFDGIDIAFNSSTASFTARFLDGSGSGVVSGTYTGLTTNGNTATSNTFGNLQMYIPNYAGSTNKSFSADMVTENNATAADQRIYAGLWSNTSAITSISLTTTTFAQYSTAYLYGLTKGSGGATVS